MLLKTGKILGCIQICIIMNSVVIDIVKQNHLSAFWPIFLRNMCRSGNTGLYAAFVDMKSQLLIQQSFNCIPVIVIIYFQAKGEIWLLMSILI